MRITGFGLDRSNRDAIVGRAASRIAALLASADAQPTDVVDLSAEAVYLTTVVNAPWASIKIPQPEQQLKFSTFSLLV